MKTSNDRQLSWVVSRTLPLVLLSVLAGCSGAGTEASKSSSPKNPDTPELFSVPQEQMSHVQVLTVQPSTLDSYSASDRDGRLQQLSDHAGDRTGKRPDQPDGRRSRAASSSWRAHALCVQSRFLPASNQLSESPRCECACPQNLRSRPGLLPAPRHRSERSGAGRVGRGAGFRRPGIGGSCIESDGSQRS